MVIWRFPQVHSELIQRANIAQFTAHIPIVPCKHTQLIVR